MTTQELLNHINNFIAPISPFDDEDYSSLSVQDNQRRKLFATENPNEIANGLIEIIIQQPPCKWPDREDSYLDEICEFAGLFKNTPHSQQILLQIAPYLSDSKKRSLVIKVIGELGLEEGITFLEQLPIKELNEDDLTDLACSIGRIGGKHAIDFLTQLKKNEFTVSSIVQQEIEIAIQNMKNPE